MKETDRAWLKPGWTHMADKDANYFPSIYYQPGLFSYMQI